MKPVLFKPERRAKCVSDIDFRKEARNGIRGIIFDIDNTLVSHGAPADKDSVLLFCKLHEAGFRTCLISNNDKERVQPFAEAVGTLFIEKAGKPFGSGFKKAMKLLETDTDSTLFIGDQILTDVLGARLHRVHHILVEPVDLGSEPRGIKFKRKIEHLLLKK